MNIKNKIKLGIAGIILAGTSALGCNSLAPETNGIRKELREITNYQSPELVKQEKTKKDYTAPAITETEKTSAKKDLVETSSRNPPITLYLTKFNKKQLISGATIEGENRDGSISEGINGLGAELEVYLGKNWSIFGNYQINQEKGKYNDSQANLSFEGIGQEFGIGAKYRFVNGNKFQAAVKGELAERHESNKIKGYLIPYQGASTDKMMDIDIRDRTRTRGARVGLEGHLTPFGKNNLGFTLGGTIDYFNERTMGNTRLGVTVYGGISAPFGGQGEKK